MSPVLSSGVWHVGVDPGWGHRLFPPSCSQLGDVCCHRFLDFDGVSVYNLPHQSPLQVTTDPLDNTGNMHKAYNH